MKTCVLAAVAAITLFLSHSTVYGGCGKCPSWMPDYRDLQQEVKCLNHAMVFFEIQLDRWLACSAKGAPTPKRLSQQLLRLDEAVQHVDAELILKEAPPEKIQKQIDRICRQLEEAEIAFEAGNI